MHRHTTQQGFFLIEVIVAASIMSVVFVLLSNAIQGTVDVSRHALERTQASYILEEGAEAIKSIRDQAWTNISGLTLGTTYYFSWNGSNWVTTTTPQVLNNEFTRSIVLSAVYRDGSDNIASSGTLDAGTVKCVETVSWVPPSSPQSHTQTQTMTFYIANIYN